MKVASDVFLLVLGGCQLEIFSVQEHLKASQGELEAARRDAEAAKLELEETRSKLEKLQTDANEKDSRLNELEKKLQDALQAEVGNHCHGFQFEAMPQSYHLHGGRNCSRFGLILLMESCFSESSFLQFPMDVYCLFLCLQTTTRAELERFKRHAQFQKVFRQSNAFCHC